MRQASRLAICLYVTIGRADRSIARGWIIRAYRGS
jgi:hypothetical protein